MLFISVTESAGGLHSDVSYSRYSLRTASPGDKSISKCQVARIDAKARGQQCGLDVNQWAVCSFLVATLRTKS